jgi:hypothetical protein
MRSFAEYNRAMKLLSKRAGNTAAFVAGVLSLAFSMQLLHAQDEERGRKYKAPPPISHISVTVTRASNGKPVENAAVIFHTFHNGKDMGNMELKTDEDGKAVLDVIPIGDEVRLQVFKIGFQTYGNAFTNDLASRDFKIKVKPPTGQYSAYESHPVDANGQQSVTPQPTEGSAKPPAPPHN